MNLAPQIALMRTLLDDYEAAVKAGRTREARDSAYQATKVLLVLYNAAAVADRKNPGGEMAL
ncbi:MAG: hypothetical protein JJE27_03570 [Thermoleophilia bacterium]|nr:hypothetical protein [Thermoleophilia bacterium]